MHFVVTREWKRSVRRCEWDRVKERVQLLKGRRGWWWDRFGPRPIEAHASQAILVQHFFNLFFCCRRLSVF